jgi:hypothetical protein
MGARGQAPHNPPVVGSSPTSDFTRSPGGTFGATSLTFGLSVTVGDGADFDRIINAMAGLRPGRDARISIRSAATAGPAAAKGPRRLP